MLSNGPPPRLLARVVVERRCVEIGLFVIFMTSSVSSCTRVKVDSWVIRPYRHPWSPPDDRSAATLWFGLIFTDSAQFSRV